MKSMEQLVAEEVEKAGCKPEEMEELNLDERCRSKSVMGLDAFVSLKELSICHVGLTTLEGFPALPQLKVLQLADNKLSSGLGKLCGLKALEKLNLVHNLIVSIDELRPLAELNIKQLDMFACPVEEKTEDFRDKVFTILPSLEILDNLDKSGKGASGSDENSDSEYSEEDEYDEESGDASDEEEEGEEQEEGGEGGEEDSFDPDEKEDEAEDNQPPSASRVDISVLVGSPIVDGDDDEDYQQDGDDSGSEEVVDDADEDGDSECDGGNSIDQTRPIDGKGSKKRKYEECGDKDEDR